VVVAPLPRLPARRLPPLRRIGKTGHPPTLHNSGKMPFTLLR